MQLWGTSVAGGGPAAAAIYGIIERGPIHGLYVQVDDRIVVDACGFEPNARIIA